MKRHVITIDDLSNEEIRDLFDLADRYVQELGEDSLSHRLKGHLDVANDFIAATLFFEPSTRTKFSFEAAMFRLGGNILQAVDAKNTSSSKGESLADTVRVVQSYADILILRHPLEGAARAAAQKIDIPVINAGDGSHEHPTQTLCDLYTLRRERGSLENMNVIVCGDLKNGRTVHSLVYALGRFDAVILTSPAGGLELPPHVRERLVVEHGYEVRTREDGLELPEYIDAVFIPRSRIKHHAPSGPAAAADSFVSVDDLSLDGQEALNEVFSRPTAFYQTPVEPHSLSLTSTAELVQSAVAELSVFYMTRLQKERLKKGSKGPNYPVIDKNFLDSRGYTDTKVLHPLPRVSELGADLDQDPRGAYFRQTAYGVPIRMALIAALLGIEPILGPRGSDAHYFRSYTPSDRFACTNLKCITKAKSERINKSFWIVNSPQRSFINERPFTLRCMYCEYDYQPVVAKFSTKEYFTDSRVWDRIEKHDLMVFESIEEAEDTGFQSVTVPSTAALV